MSAREMGLVAAGMVTGFVLVMGVSSGALFATEAAWVDDGKAIVPVEAGAIADDRELPFTSGDANTIVGDDPDEWTWTKSDSSDDPPVPNAFCAAFEVSTTSETPVPFRVRVNLAVQPFNFPAPFATGDYTSNVWVDPFSSWEETPDFVNTGLVDIVPFENATISASSPLTMRVCANVPDPPWSPPGDTTYTVLAPVLDVSGGNPCVTLTVVGHTPYFLGFTANFDYHALLDDALTDGVITQAQYDSWLPRVYWWGSTASGVTGADHLVTFTGYNALTRFVNLFSNVVLTACTYN
ncbi:hypothetical protein [Protaetiibacter intestinalis]|uniref:Uncharacterized protein n=1 Tax=Protaetiibacter intestinalis TaxID=2419774 RepID=A0A387B8V7_9MICO|nr:hypothetical protein [Protaetiibacter intestinalis]AYF98797.1 hypothetical protein D7I47_11410 [Protaetiibacter intestinalis]